MMRITHLEDEVYQVVLEDVFGTSVLYQGSLSDCHSYIEINQIYE